MDTIIRQLKFARQRLGLRQSELGAKLGLPQSHISKIEQGSTDPRLSTVTDMARILDQELILVPRQMILPIQALLQNDQTQEPRWQPDEDENT